MAGWWATGRGPVIGREDEVAVLANFLAAGRDTSEALVLDGEAGIGKSTLWLAGVEHARAQGLRVLSSRPAEAERGLAHAGLGDLFEDVLDEVLPALPRAEAARARGRAPSRGGRRAMPSIPARSAVAVRDVLQLLASGSRS